MSTDMQNISMQMCEDAGHQLLYLVRSGSHAYGTNTETSDIDTRGVFIPSWTGLVGLHPIDMLDKTADDIVLYSLRNFIRKCADGNPNILDWMFVPPHCVHVVDPIFQRYIVANRHLFLSRRLHPRFRGYAYSHLQKMDRGVTRHLGAKRKAMIEEHGYSTKNAMHLIRLARMGCEVLETGEYNVFREDADELLKIKAGKFTAKEVREMGSDLIARMDIALDNSPLPLKPDTKEINKLLVNMTLDTKRWQR